MDLLSSALFWTAYPDNIGQVTLPFRKKSLKEAKLIAATADLAPKINRLATQQ